MEIFVRHDAELDAIACFEYIGERNPAAAVRFLAAVDQTVLGLAMHPLKGRLRKFRGEDLKGIRSWRVDGFENHLVFYRVTESRLEILHIKHGAMRFPKALGKM
ncbi:MAG TPA: type II toxin-antitoxin system RelE/ParE family toxin [Verrucomicrobiae bacterium]